MMKQADQKLSFAQRTAWSRKLAGIRDAANLLKQAEWNYLLRIEDFNLCLKDDHLGEPAAGTLIQLGELLGEDRVRKNLQLNLTKEIEAAKKYIKGRERR